MRHFFLLFSCSVFSVQAQFAPAAGQPGSTAIRHDSTCFVAWANKCSVQRGYMDISQPDSGYAAVGDSTAAIGKALQNGVVSLGDKGMATLQFPLPITNGPGWDFAVFENTFIDSFLELAFVEVSSDGKKFVRFAAVSLTDTTKQTGGFGYTKPQHINNLAGKYRSGFGTPFDLEELKDSSGINVDQILFVRLVDVIGCLQPSYVQRDSKGNKINDPWPTRFPSSGFDLDAVGIINQMATSATSQISEINIRIWPNPSTSGILHISSSGAEQIAIYTLQGQYCTTLHIQKGENEIPLNLPAGMFVLRAVESSWHSYLWMQP